MTFSFVFLLKIRKVHFSDYLRNKAHSPTLLHNEIDSEICYEKMKDCMLGKGTPLVVHMNLVTSRLNNLTQIQFFIITSALLDLES